MIALQIILWEKKKTSFIYKILLILMVRTLYVLNMWTFSLLTELKCFLFYFILFYFILFFWPTVHIVDSSPSLLLFFLNKLKIKCVAVLKILICSLRTVYTHPQREFLRLSQYNLISLCYVLKLLEQSIIGLQLSLFYFS